MLHSQAEYSFKKCQLRKTRTTYVVHKGHHTDFFNGLTNVQFSQLNNCSVQCPAFLQKIPILSWQASHYKKTEALTIREYTEE